MNTKIALMIFMLGSCLLLSAGCAAFSAIERYTEVRIKPDTSNVYILTRERTYNHCAQIRKAIVVELGRRESRVLGDDDQVPVLRDKLDKLERPERQVTVPLSILSGTALLSFLPSFNSLETRATSALMILDKALTEQAFLDQEEADATDPETKRAIRERRKDNIRRIDDLTASLKQTLVDWTNAAQ